MILTDAGPLIALADAGDPDHDGCSAALMGKYADTPMDLADATLVATAEDLGTDRIFTIDRDFHVYRTSNRKRFKLIP